MGTEFRQSYIEGSLTAILVRGASWFDLEATVGEAVDAALIGQRHACGHVLVQVDAMQGVRSALCIRMQAESNRCAMSTTSSIDHVAESISSRSPRRVEIALGVR